MARPDREVRHDLAGCCGCGAGLAGRPVTSVERHQVFDLPPARVEVTEHQLIERECGCGQRARAADGLPTAYSGDNGFWYWGPPPTAATMAVVVGYKRSQLGFCRTVRLAGQLNNREGVKDDEQGAPVWICQPDRT